jgi:coronin-1B/1C/6
VLATGSSDKTLKIWDVEAGKDVLSFDGIHTDVIHSIDWNYTGSLVVTISKDKKLRIIDPRSNSVVQVL